MCPADPICEIVGKENVFFFIGSAKIAANYPVKGYVRVP